MFVSKQNPLAAAIASICDQTMAFSSQSVMHAVLCECLKKLWQNTLKVVFSSGNGSSILFSYVGVSVLFWFGCAILTVMCERGMFRSEHIRSYKAKVDNKELTDKRRKSEDSITFGKIQSKIGLVDSLNDDGFPFIGANMQSGDIMIGKCAESGTDHSSELPASLPLLHRWINLKFGHVVRLSVIHVLNGGDENGTLQQGDMDA
uniref:DNA-directed RNA polymerase subunit 2 hybrid-binding domain-containing protein n=1 Tax=Salix viminalis TaxID=40686 RepID=A0A6N2LLZ6_SALVM